MQKVNYQKKLDPILKGLEETGEVPKLLLHSCCAPCSSYVLEYLSDYFEIIILYYNPNISPEEEYRKREGELKRLISEMPFRHPVRMEPCRYDPERYFEAVKGHEADPEGGERCGICFEMRLREAAENARRLGCDFFTTSLTISPLKDAQRLNRIGAAVAEKYGVNFLPSDFKKRGGYQRSIELSRAYHLYRQNFCGCVFSKQEREAELRMA